MSYRGVSLRRAWQRLWACPLPSGSELLLPAPVRQVCTCALQLVTPGHSWGVTDYRKGCSLPLPHPTPPLPSAAMAKGCDGDWREGLNKEDLSSPHSRRPPSPTPACFYSIFSWQMWESFVQWILSNPFEDIEESKSGLWMEVLIEEAWELLILSLVKVLVTIAWNN